MFRDLKEKLGEFQCRRCGECCRREGFVYLKSGEADQMALFLEMDPFAFVNRYCELQDRRQLILKTRETGECVFLEDDGCCRVYSGRPRQCRGFPAEWRTKGSFEYCKGLRELSPCGISGYVPGCK